MSPTTSLSSAVPWSSHWTTRGGQLRGWDLILMSHDLPSHVAPRWLAPAVAPSPHNGKQRQFIPHVSADTVEEKVDRGTLFDCLSFVCLGA